MSLTRWPELREWLAGARAQFGDPSEPVCQLFVRWQATAGEHHDLTCNYVEGRLLLALGPDLPIYPLEITVGDMQINQGGELEVFGVRRIAAGLWALVPSLNDIGQLHAYVILYGLPDPAPFERRIITP